MINSNYQRRCKYDATQQEIQRRSSKISLNTPQAIAKTVRDLGIKESPLYAWVNVAKDKAPITTNEAGNQSSLIDVLNRLRKENSRLKKEREILKKGHSILRERSEVKFKFMNNHLNEFLFYQCVRYSAYREQVFMHGAKGQIVSAVKLMLACCPDK